ncbi:hypothetical protein HPB49_008083 [Dermacentor silvarum]|uniref:Uncharacterized protein n=1 Tax=Dermacentor silvarum TaxID=543639 RepID=A0ACB8DN69_DERSI|nr:hypothetical protein HPB49_008083 [Dermacentor silvarum]
MAIVSEDTVPSVTKCIYVTEGLYGKTFEAFILNCNLSNIIDFEEKLTTIEDFERMVETIDKMCRGGPAKQKYPGVNPQCAYTLTPWVCGGTEVSTVRKYISLVRPECGFDDRFFEAFKKRLLSKKDIQRHGMLVFDEIQVRQGREVNAKTFSYIGQVQHHDTSEPPLAHHALVFMFVPFADSYTQPVGVFASKGPTKGRCLSWLVHNKRTQLLSSCVPKISLLPSTVCEPATSVEGSWATTGLSVLATWLPGLSWDSDVDGAAGDGLWATVTPKTPRRAASGWRPAWYPLPHASSSPRQGPRCCPAKAERGSSCIVILLRRPIASISCCPCGEIAPGLHCSLPPVPQVMVAQAPPCGEGHRAPTALVWLGNRRFGNVVGSQAYGAYLDGAQHPGAMLFEVPLEGLPPRCSLGCSVGSSASLLAAPVHAAHGKVHREGAVLKGRRSCPG